MAFKWGLIKNNPADAVTAPRPQRTEMKTLNEKDLNLFLEAAKETPYYLIFHLALSTGMRRSELLALKWCDVDLLLCQIYISRSLHRLRNGEIIFREPKSTAGKRMVALPPSIALLLQNYKDDQANQRQTLGLELNDEDLVFSNIEGRPFLPDTVSHAWMKLIKKTGLEGIRLHDARHSHASLLLKQGVHPKVVQERLGHATISTTLDLYSHITPSLQQAAAEGFDKMLPSGREKETSEKHY